MGRDPTRVYFWHALNKGLTLIWPDEIFFSSGKKNKNWDFLGEIFQTQRWLTQHDLGQKKFTWTHHYLQVLVSLGVKYVTHRITFSAAQVWLMPEITYHV